MSPSRAEYESLITALREQRRSATWHVDQDDPILEAMDASYRRMTQDERDAVKDEGWKSDPAKYDSRLE